MSERTKHLLSLCGVLLSIAGFYLANAASFPLLQGIVAPQYVNAKGAIERLQQEGVLQVGEPGFDVLAGLISEEVASQNPGVDASQIVLERLEVAGGGITFGRASSRNVIRLNMHFRGQPEPLRWDLLQLAAVVEQLWTTRSLRWALFVFWLGVVQTVWPLLLDLRPKGSSAKASRSTSDGGEGVTPTRGSVEGG